MRGLILLLCTFALVLQMQAQVRTEHEPMAQTALELFEARSYEQALPLYSQLVSLYPRDAELNFRFGACALLGGEEKSTAIKHLNFGARKNGPTEAWYYLGLAHHRNYDFKAAEEAYETFKRKADEKLLERLPVTRQLEMCRNGKGLLSSIVDVVVLDKKQSLAEEFFRYYNLEGIGGKILTTPEELLTKTDKKQEHLGVIHYPKGAQVVYFSSYGSNTKTGKDIYTATIVEGSFTNIAKLEGPVNTGFDEDYPYMHPDGETLYFASKGHNSMGGYDIFMSKLDKVTGSWMPPVNLDFAINTPDDDLFYVADSLNQRAFFASARSSSQANLHVYEVMVGGIPVNLIFLQGTFLNEVPEGSRSAKIEIVDELTGRPVATVNTDPVTGAYLCSIPKSGLYQVRVEAESSVYTHQGQINLPLVESSVAFQQELKLLKVDGQEKLIIDNYFDVPLDADIAALSRDYLLQAAGLDVNASEERIAAIQATDDAPQATMDTGAEPQWAAGFDRSMSMDDVRADSEKQAAALDSRATELDEAALTARNLATYRAEEARNAVTEAAAIWDSADHSTSEAYTASVNAYVAALKTAEDATQEAQAALETAQGLEQFANDKRQEATDIRSHTNQAATSWEAGDFNAATEHLRWEKDRQNDTSDGEVNPADTDKQKAYQLQQKQLEILEDVSAANAAIDKLERDKKRLEKELTEEPKKSRVKEIQAELDAIAGELTPLKATLHADRTQVTRISSEELLLLRKAALFESLVDGSADLPAGVDATGTPNNNLASDLRNLERDLDALDRNDDVMLALTSEETVKTRNDITAIPAIQARAEALGITLALSSDLRAQVKPFLKDWSGEEDSYQRRTGIEMMQRTVAQQLRVLDGLTGSLVDADDKAALAAEHEALQTLASDLGGWMERLDVIPMAPIELDSYAAATLVMPTYRNQMQEIRTRSESDLEQSIRTRALNEQAMRALEDQLVVRQQALIDTDDAMAAEQLARDIHQTKSALTALSSSTEDITGMQDAYESDHAAIVASDERYRQKVEEQLALTQRYLDAMEAARGDRVLALEQAYAPEQQEGINAAIALLDLQIGEAQNKIDVYSIDLERAITASDPPAETATSEFDTASNDSAEAPSETVLNPETESAVADQTPTQAVTETEGSSLDQPGTVADSSTEGDADSSTTDVSQGTSEDLTAQNAGDTAPSSEGQPIDEDSSFGAGSDPGVTPDSAASPDANETSANTLENTDVGQGNETPTALPDDNASESPEGSADANTNRPETEVVTLSSTEALEVSSTVMPSFQTAILDAQRLNEDPEAKRLLTELLDRTQREIADQSGLLEVIEDPFLSEAIEVQLVKLRGLEQKTVVYLKTLEGQGVTALDLPVSEEVAAVDATTDQPLETASTDQNTDQKLQSEALQAAVSYSEDERDFIAHPAIENANQVEALRQEVGALEMDFKAEPSQRKRNNIAKEIAKVEARLAKEELQNHEMLTLRSAEAYEVNHNALDSLEVDYADQLEFVSSLQEAITRYRTKARFKFDDAANLREQAADIKNDADRNALLNAALGLEVQAMQLQEDALRIYDQFEAPSTETLDQPTTETLQPDAVETDVPENNFTIETIEVTPFEAVESVDDVTEWTETVGLDPEQLKALNNTEALEVVQLAFAAVTTATAEVNTLRQDRSALQAQVNDYAEQLTRTDLTTETKRRIMADAQVVYNALEVNEAALFAAELTLEKTQDAALETLTEAALPEVLEEIEAAEAADLASESTLTAPESNVSDLATTNLADTSTEPEAPGNADASPDTASDSTPDPTSGTNPDDNPDAVAASGTPSPSIISVSAAEALLVMPEVLSRELFGVVEASIYSEERRIPLNTPRPAGIVYAVQVGAYRNSIPQDLFAQFAPLYGDELGNGITRYTAGLFLNFANADQAKAAIRGFGYSDAFVVAYRDGQRISIGDARSASGDQGPVAAALLPEATRTSDQIETPEVQTEAQAVLEQSPNYNYAPGAALATPVESTTGVFYTVQVGVYTNPVSSEALNNIEPLNTERLANGTIRYTSGQFANLSEASIRKDQIRGRGVQDAFVTAYINGKRVAVSEARSALGTGSAPPLQETLSTPQEEVKGYEVIIGSFIDEIPAEAARAMLLLEGEYGIRQRQVGGRTEYFTEAVATRNQAEAIRDAFISMGVGGVLIQAVE